MLYIRTFGGLNITYEGQASPLLPGRNTKMWKLLKYLLACYPSPVTVEKLIEAVWSAGEITSDPGKNVRDVIYRLRQAFSSLGTGNDYILFTNGCYFWNPDAECFMDFMEFNRLLSEGNDSQRSDEERISSYNAAVSLYKGEFMGERWSIVEKWASNFVLFYKRSFLNAVEFLSDLYEQKLDYENIISLHNKALLVEPYEESLYARLIQVLIKSGEYAEAERQYRHLEKFFSKEFNTSPSLTLQNLYEEAVKASVRQPAALHKIKELFDERAERERKGPILCAPDTFAQIYSYGKRVDERVNLPVFLSKITLLSDGTEELTKAELEQSMRALLNILLYNLRKGDIICRYSLNQILMLLTAADGTNLKQSIQRIGTMLKEESESGHIVLDIDTIPIRDSSENV